jgi:integrase
MLDDILAAAKMTDDTFHNILSMLLLTGIRPKDLLSLKVGDINFEERKIFIRMSKTDKEINIPISKSLNTFITNNMKKVLELDAEQFVFQGYSVARVGRRFRKLKKKLGIKEKFTFTLKTFRNTFATHYAKSLTIQDVAYLLGHDEIETTKAFYTDMIIDSVRNKMDEHDDKQNGVNY